jgi:hypothetical protein
MLVVEVGQRMEDNLLGVVEQEGVGQEIMEQEMQLQERLILVEVAAG